MAPASLSPDTPFAIKVIVRNHKDSAPVENASVSVQLYLKEGKCILAENYRTDSAGTLTAFLKTPPGIGDDQVEMRVSIRSSLGMDILRKTLPFRPPVRISLITDKSAYAPGQTIFLRALTVNPSTLAPLPSRPVEISVRDPGNTVIFRTSGTTSSFGIFAAELPLADILKPGSYTVKAQSLNECAETTIHVDDVRYGEIFIDLETEKKYFFPGDAMAGRILARTAKDNMPVSVPLTLELSLRSDEGDTPAGSVSGKTDRAGYFPFYFTLPANQKAKILVCTVTVSDGKGQSLQKAWPVSDKPFIISCMPEGGELIPGLPARLFLLSSYPDGEPAPVELEIKAGERSLSLATDEWGIASFPVDSSREGTQIKITARDSRGSVQEVPVDLYSFISPNTFMIQTDKVLYRAGETIEVDIRTIEDSSPLYMDLILNGQVFMSKTLPARKGKDHVSLGIPGGLTGFARLQVTGIDHEGNFRSDSQNLFIFPSHFLKIGIHADRKSYLPGESATWHFTCRAPSSKEAVLAVSLVEGGGSGGERLPFETLVFPRGVEFPHRIPLPIRADLAKVLKSYAPDLAAGSLQTRARIAFSSLVLSEDAQYCLNFYDAKLDSNQKRKHHYFSQLFLNFFLLLLITGIVCFIIILALTLTHAYLKGKDEKRILFIKDNEEVIGIFVFIIGFFILLLVPVLFIIPVLLFSNIEVIAHHRSFFQVFLIIEIFLMFVYLIALWRNSRVRPIRKMPTLKYSFFTLQWYIGILIVVIGILFTISVMRWDLGLVLSSSTTYLVLTLLTICAMPFLLLYNALSHMTRPRRSLFRLISFYASSFMIIGALLCAFYVIFANQAFIRKDIMSRFLPESHPVRKTDREEKCECPQCIFGEPQADVRQGIHTLSYIPQLLTSGDGRADLTLEIPESPAPLSIEATGLTRQGIAGFSSQAVNSYREFSMQLNAPDFLTIGDEISVPVRLENHAKSARDAAVACFGTPGISVKNPRPVKITLQPGTARTIYMPVRVTAAGTETVSVQAKIGAVTITRTGEIEVIPPGEMMYISRSGWLKENVTTSIATASDMPGRTGARGQKMLIKIYAGLVPLIKDASTARMRVSPGNLEEALASTYPHVLLLRYLTQSGINAPQLQKSLEQAALIGYQRLLSFETRDGGFSLFGDSPGSIWITASVLACLIDMKDVSTVDERVIERTAEWLLYSRNPDGSWNKSPRTTAYVLLSLMKAGKLHDHRVQKAVDYLRSTIKKDTDPYTLGLCALLFLEKDSDSSFTRRLIAQLPGIAVEKGEKSYWSPGPGTISTPSGTPADIETTAICARVLILSHGPDLVIERAMNYLIESRDPRGSWYSTAATIEAIKTLMAAGEDSGIPSSISVLLNGRTLKSLDLKSRSDFIEPIILLNPPPNSQISFKSSARALYQVIGSFTLPEREISKPKNTLQFSIDYSRKRVARNGVLTKILSAANRGEKETGMLIVQIGVPAGFEVMPEDLERLKKDGKIRAFTIRSDEIYMYLGGLKRGEKVTFPVGFRALFPVNVSTPPSCAYEYNNPESRSFASPARLIISP